MIMGLGWGGKLCNGISNCNLRTNKGDMGACLGSQVSIKNKSDMVLDWSGDRELGINLKIKLRNLIFKVECNTLFLA